MTHPIQNEIVAFLNRRENLRGGLTAYFSNTSEPLEERWNLFIISGNILPIHTWVHRVMDIYSDCLYDDFHIERRETVLFADIDEQVVSNLPADGEEPDEYNCLYFQFFQKRDLWREAVLASGYSGFTYDW